MGPISNKQIWIPIDPAERPAGGELAMNGDKDRSVHRLPAQRRRHRETNPDADEFTHQEPEPEPNPEG